MITRVGSTVVDQIHIKQTACGLWIEWVHEMLNDKDCLPKISIPS